MAQSGPAFTIDWSQRLPGLRPVRKKASNRLLDNYQMLSADEEPRIEVQDDQSERQILQPKQAHYKRRIKVINRPMKGLFHYEERQVLEEKAKMRLAVGLGPNTGTRDWTVANSKLQQKIVYSERLRAFHKVFPPKMIKKEDAEQKPSAFEKAKMYGQQVIRPKIPADRVKQQKQRVEFEETSRFDDFETLDRRSRLLSHNVRLIKHGYEPF